MTSAEVRALVEAEIGGDWPQSNSHAVDLRRCLVHPRQVAGRDPLPKLDAGTPLQLWIVLEEMPGAKDGYLIVFDERRREFGLATWDGEMPVFVGFYGSFLNTLKGM